MARLTEPFDGFPEYDDFDELDEYMDRQGEVMNSLREEAEDVGSEDENLTGALLRWHRADGYAIYRVTDMDPLTLQHVPYGDAWQVEGALIRGLREEDVRNRLSADETLNELFG